MCLCGVCDEQRVYVCVLQVGLFMLGYAGIILEETVAFNKSGVALLMAAGLWTIRAFSAPETVRALAWVRVRANPSPRVRVRAKAKP